MAFSDEDKEEMKAMFSEFLASQTKQEEPKDKEEEKDKGLLTEAKNNMTSQNNQQEEQSNIEKALGFNMTISTFAEKYKDILPASVKPIIDTANGKTYTSAIAKADEIRKAIIEAYLEIQANVDCLPDGIKAKAGTFASLTEDAKRTKSGQFWEIVEVGAELQTAKKRAEAVNRANGNNNGGEDNAFRQRFLSLGDKYKRKD